ncbi:MAG: hypothetical protein NZ610_07735 [Candidatus Bipolaricaulota bacterium]|nr:hypothetical protein [Candidatus Bipolaricaulota bacterium]MCS7275270.1 hypothetical protein [Candidatus Bipolaricaulota bacterium]MDW8329438.1 hypothetical protein [Candidatus Bipolaricaulota bacterium]
MNRNPAIWTTYIRSSIWKTGRIVLDNIELLNFPKSYESAVCSSIDDGIQIGSGMELEVNHSVFRGFGTAIVSFHDSPSGEMSDEPRMTIRNSYFYHNCRAIMAQRLQLVNTKIEKNAIGVFVSGNASMKDTIIAEQDATSRCLP